MSRTDPGADWTGGAAFALPSDAHRATLVGRVWDPAAQGPSVVAVRDGHVIDLSAKFPTMRELTEHPDPVDALEHADGPRIASVDAVVRNAGDDRDADRPWLLSPVDLHVLKGAGVTFPASMLERVIEERAGGEKGAAERIRAAVQAVIGDDLQSLVPGSPEAEALKTTLIAEGMWSPYLEVGIGPEAEVFTKAPVLSSVGSASDIGVRADSQWNNPEPEAVLIVNSRGTVVGGTLGNDVNLRDVEGRSTLLLTEAKDNNGSAAIGPFIRLLDASFTLDRLRRQEIRLRVDGPDGFELDATTSLAQISRDPLALVAQAIGRRHQYPDGFALYLGTPFAPTEDRGAAGEGFTHERGDIVRISSEALGGLVNRVRTSEELAPWTFGIAALFEHLARRAPRNGGTG